MSALLLIVVLLSGGLVVDRFEGICPICELLNLRSKTFVRDWTITSMDCGGGYWDEKGFFVPPPMCNYSTKYYSCTNDHEFRQQGPTR
jgi:hypothetical protein